MNLLLYTIGTLVGGIKQNWHFRDRLLWKSRNPCYDGQIKHFLVKRVMVSGMTDYIIFQKSHLWWRVRKGVYCANEQSGCRYVLQQMKFGNTFSWEQTLFCYKRRCRDNFLAECAVSHCRKGMSALPAREDSHYLTPMTVWPRLSGSRRWIRWHKIEGQCLLLQASGKQSYQHRKSEMYFFQTINMIHFKTGISLELTLS